MSNISSRTRFIRRPLALAALAGAIAAAPLSHASAGYRYWGGAPAGAIAAGVVGGMMLGAMAAEANRGRVVYAQPVYGRCHWRTVAVYDACGCRLVRQRVCD